MTTALHNGTASTVKLILNNQEIAGWTDVRITRGIERLPSDFDIGLTELYPSEAAEVVVKPGDACMITIGDYLALTGYVDKYIPSMGPEGHSIRITGRGKCQDLVDCSAEWETSQISAATADVIATNLASAYSGITVSCTASDLITIPQFNIMIGETAFEIIDRICKFSGLLAYDDVFGNLVLSRVGTDEHSSGLFEGQNVISASMEYSMDQRYSEYVGWLNSMPRIGDNTFTSENTTKKVNDTVVTRRRRKFIVAEAVQGYQDLLEKRVSWEKNRRAGRSQVARVKVDAWFDGSKTLWTPNTLASVYLPSLKLADLKTGQAVKWLISEVTYFMNEEGTTADLTLMAPAAFDIEPVVISYPLYDAAHPDW